ncbi:MAG: outer membrane protein assembly factor BamE domain-containing protein [Burkholderiales bacterium]
MSVTLTLASCFSTPLSPHKIDVQQGNYVDQEMVAKLKPGMTKSQVRFVLGTPLVADPFHANRWDYVFRRQKNGGPPEERKITVVFEDDKLARVDGDVVPGQLAEDAKPRVTKAPPAPSNGAAGPVKTAAEEKSLKETSLREKVEQLIAEKEGKDDSELKKSLAKLIGAEEQQAARELPRAKPVNGKEKAPPPAQQAKSDLPKAKVSKKPAEKKVAKTEEKPSDNGLRASGLSADVLSALGVRYEGDGKSDEEEVVAEDEEETTSGKPAKKKTARKSNLKADGLSADILKSLGVPFEGDGSTEEVVAEGEEEPAKEEKPGVLDELKNAEGKSVKQQLTEKFGIGAKEDKPEKQARVGGEDEASSEDEEVVPAKPTFMDDVRTVLGLGPSGESDDDARPVRKKKAAKADDEEEDIEAETEDDEAPEKPTFWDDVKTVLGLD